MEFTRENFDNLVAFVQRIAEHHSDCEDGFYSCPMAEGYFGTNDPYCNCWCGIARELLGMKNEPERRTS